MRHIDTSRFGRVDYQASDLFEFPMGLLGFAQHKQYLVLDHAEESPFKWLQCAENPELAFVITDPLFFKADYHVSVRRAELGVIEPQAVEDLVLSVILTLPDDPREMTANLMAPLVFNLVNRKAMQHVLTDRRYPVRYQIVPQAQPPLLTEPEAAAISLR